MNSNQCCPTCRDADICVYNGISYKHGDHWTQKDDPCTHCTCNTNEIKCYTEKCPTTTCSEVIKLFN